MDNQSGHDRDIPQCNLKGTVFKPGSTRGAGGVKVTATPQSGGGDRNSTNTLSDGTYSLLVPRPDEGSDPITYSVKTPDVQTTQGAQNEVVAYDTTEIKDINFNEVQN